MKLYSSGMTLIVAITCSICLSDSTYGQGVVRSSGSTNVKTSGSRSVSFSKDGKKVSITENSDGIRVSIDGKTVQAKDAAELKDKHPDAYRLYDEHIGAASYSASGRAEGKGSAGGGGSQNGLPIQSETKSSEERRIEVNENGKKVSITENKKGITVSVNGKRVRAKNVAELKKKSPDAYRLYEKHVQAAKGAKAPQGAPDAQELLRADLIKLRDENADNPQIKNLVEKMLQDLDK